MMSVHYLIAVKLISLFDKSILVIWSWKSSQHSRSFI